jgi:hypothetical protein
MPHGVREAGIYDAGYEGFKDLFPHTSKVASRRNPYSPQQSDMNIDLIAIVNNCPLECLGCFLPDV